MRWRNKLNNQGRGERGFGFFVFFLSLCLPLSSYAREVAAKKDGTAVHAEAKKESKVIKTLKKDESLKETGRKGMFWQVELASGQTGFVSVLGVKAISQDNSALASALREAVQQGRSVEDSANMRNRSAVMGVRGLDESSETAFAGNVKPNPRLVYQMENINIDAKKLENHSKLVEKEIELRMQQAGK